MTDTTCYDCSAPAHEDEGYYFEGQIVCYGCYSEAVAMAEINLDQDLETWIDDVARSYGREVPLTIWVPAQEEPRS